MNRRKKTPRIMLSDSESDFFAGTDGTLSVVERRTEKYVFSSLDVEDFARENPVLSGKKVRGRPASCLLQTCLRTPLVGCNRCVPIIVVPVTHHD